MATDYTNITGKPSVQTVVSSDISATTSVSSQVSAVQQADLQQKVTASIISAAQKVNEELNSMLSNLCKPIFDTIQEFKTIPPKIRSVVDVQGAANGLYDTLGKHIQTVQSLSSIIISVEVPITLDDYNADPCKYEKLFAIQYKNNCITEEDCLSSGYTKIEQTIDPVWAKKLLEQFPAPEARDVVGKQMEKIINSTIKTAWTTVQSPIQTIASIAPISQISEMVNSVIDSIDGVVKIASKTVSEEQLNKMVAEKQAASEKATADAKTAISQQNSAGTSISDLASRALQQASDAASQVTSGVLDGMQGAFENLQAPEFPEDVKQTLEDFKDAIIMVKDNISNIYIVVLLKMMNSVFECFNKIAGVIGVPSIPDPLGKIPQIVMDASSVMAFVNGLPMSMVKCVEAIMKRKMKMIQVSMTPIPPKPVQTLVPLPPTSKDVVKPDVEWEDSVAYLMKEYNFSRSNALDIVNCLSSFFDGSDADGFSTSVIVGSQSKQNAYGSEDWLPVFKYIRRYKMEPIECLNKYIPANVIEMTSGGFYIDVPKLNNGPRYSYHRYIDDSGKPERIDCGYLAAKETYFSEVTQ